jgi:bifunctional DNA-binding transcriptional regulator/antitoxin component of YhaV-PrlF toxin-antitoxin module
MGGMASPSLRKVHVDKQGRLVLPQSWREELVEVPGDVLLERVSDGILLRAVQGPTTVRVADDGLPVLDIDRTVTNEEVLAAIDRERGER